MGYGFQGQGQSRLFLSHSNKENFEVIALRNWLAEEGWDEVFFDIDSERGIAASARWERALHQAAMRCEAVVFLVSHAWLASGWCRKEYELARGLNKKLFAALIDPKKNIDELPPEFKDTWQIVDLTGGELVVFRVSLPGSHNEKHVSFGRDGLQRLKSGLERAGLDPKYFEWPPSDELWRAPYRGFKPLEVKDAGIFFGRDAQIVEAIDKLRGLSAAAPPRFLVILGASGAGKSSFLRAGLFPRLRRDDRAFLPLSFIRPGKGALTGKSELTRKSGLVREGGLLNALEDAFLKSTPAGLRKALDAGTAGVTPLLNELIAENLAKRVDEDEPKPPAIVILVDQAEELFRAENAQESAAFLTLLRDLALAEAPKVITIFAIRSDSYDALEHAEFLHGLPQATMLLPLQRGAYTEVIERPLDRLAKAGGKLGIHPQLTQRLLDDIEEDAKSDALPLLALTLEHLYLEHSTGDGTLLLDHYNNSGGLKGTIAAALNRVFSRANANPQIPHDDAKRKELLRRGLIPWLASVDPVSSKPRRHIARKKDIPPEAVPLLELLVEERLLSTSAQQEANADVMIEPAHEALLRQWDDLAGWLKEDTELLVTLDQVQHAARDWDAHGRHPDWATHSGARLEEAVTLVKERPDIAAGLDATDRAYLAECSKKEKEREQEIRQKNNELQRSRATKFGQQARVELQNGNVDRALRFAALGTKIGLGAPGSAGASFSAAVSLVATLEKTDWRLTLSRYGSSVTSAAFSPDGTRIVTASEDKTARIWDVRFAVMPTESLLAEACQRRLRGILSWMRHLKAIFSQAKYYEYNGCANDDGHEPFYRTGLSLGQGGHSRARSDALCRTGVLSFPPHAPGVRLGCRHVGREPLHLPGG